MYRIASSECNVGVTYSLKKCVLLKDVTRSPSFQVNDATVSHDIVMTLPGFTVSGGRHALCSCPLFLLLQEEPSSGCLSHCITPGVPPGTKST